MHFLINFHKVIKPCQSPSLDTDFFQIPLAFLHDSLGSVVLCKILKCNSTLFKSVSMYCTFMYNLCFFFTYSSRYDTWFLDC